MDIRHYLQFKDFSRDEYEYLFERTRWIKDKFKRYVPHQPLRDRSLAMVFEKQSTRTRVSFEAGMRQLGGTVITLITRDTQMGRGEPIEDVARVITRMVDIVMIRTFEQAIIERFAEYSRVPVVNGLTNEYHPCQILGDIYTFVEYRGSSYDPTTGYPMNPVTVSATDLVLDRIPPVADLSLGVTWTPMNRLLVRATVYNALLQHAYNPDVLGDYEPHLEYLPNPYEGIRAYISALYQY